ncbi:hypothetical protein IJI28_02785 [Candidatus Saccharibacteria bacterium]|nr:hypothetical protein [Candidatus Saccharibacteria bacterium]
MKHTSKSSLYIISSLTITTIISGLILSSASVSADNDSVVDEINITVPVSCTLSGTGMNTHNAEINNGQYNSAIGETTLKTFCNDNEGFAIYAIGYTDNGDGKNVLTNSTLGNTYDIETGTAITGNDSQWAMKLSTITSPTPTYPIIIAGSTDDTEKEQGDLDYSTFQEVPDDYTLVAKRTAGTDIGTNAEGATLKSTYQAYISKTQPAGTYIGQVKYTLVHPYTADPPEKPFACPANSICYLPNATITDTMGDQTIQAADTEATLWASNFQRPGYGFAGWSETPDYSDPTKIYGPNETIHFTTGQFSGRDDGLTLYAYWVESTGYLQNLTTEQCSAMTTNQITALTDNRDNNVYTIAKLADGNCWMVENLRLANEYTVNNVTTPVILSSANTNNPNLPLTNSDGNTSNSLSTPTDYTTTWCIDDDPSCIDQSMLETNNTTNLNTINSPNDDIYAYGNYYNWYSATAGNGTYTYTGNTEGDICPMNWRLPTGNIGGDFDILNLVVNQGKTNDDSDLRIFPTNFVYSGSIWGKGLVDRGKSGIYWSSTADYGGTSSFFYSNQSSSLNDEMYEWPGVPVRCLLKTN